MKLKEFVAEYMGSGSKKEKKICPVCKKEITDEKNAVADIDGVLYHKDCFDEATGNNELK